MSRINIGQRRQLQAMISPLDTEARRERYLAGDFPRADRVKDLDKRYRWDLLWLATDNLPGQDLISDLYETCNDSHIDTALRAIVPALSSQEATS